MFSVPLKAKVQCADEDCGESVAVVIDPINHQVTHVVLEDKTLPQPEKTRMVPVEQIQESSPTAISLRLTKAEMASMDPFVQTQYVQIERPAPGGGGGYMTPNTVPQMETVEVEEHEEVIPEGAVALHRGSKVEAADGTAGDVAEFVIDPTSGNITLLVLVQGHFWDKKVTSIPVSSIDRVADDVVYLKLNKQAIAELPAMSVNEYRETGGPDLSSNAPADSTLNNALDTPLNEPTETPLSKRLDDETDRPTDSALNEADKSMSNEPIDPALDEPDVPSLDEASEPKPEDRTTE